MTDSLRGVARRGTSSPASQIHVFPPNSAGERSQPASLRNGMPGGLTHTAFSSPTDPQPSTSQFTRTPRLRSSRLGSELRDEDDAVSSAFSTGSMTTPPARYQTLGPEGAEGMGRPPSMVSRLGSVNTAVYSAPDSAATEDMTGIGTINQVKKKGRKKK